MTRLTRQGVRDLGFNARRRPTARPYCWHAFDHADSCPCLDLDWYYGAYNGQHVERCIKCGVARRGYR